MEQKPLHRSLYFQVITGIATGVLLGHCHPETGAGVTEAVLDPIDPRMPVAPAR